MAAPYCKSLPRHPLVTATALRCRAQFSIASKYGTGSGSNSTVCEA